MAVEGKIVQVTGPVLDVEFPSEHLPEIYNAIHIKRDVTGEDSKIGSGASQNILVAEVQQHLGNDWVRCVAMGSTDGIRRGMTAVDTGQPIAVPVGPPTLGRIFNVLGQTVDGGPPVKVDKTYSIHRP